METQERSLKPKAYIAGKISGENQEAVYLKFERKQSELVMRGYEVINPVVRIMEVNLAKIELDELPLKEDRNRKEIMGICLYDLSTCDELHLLHDWQESQGALQEVAFAVRHGIKLVYPHE